jgi:hypothetical protein
MDSPDIPALLMLPEPDGSFHGIKSLSLNANPKQGAKTMRLISPPYDSPKETISKEELVAGMLASGCVTLVEAKVKAIDRNLTIRIRKNARAAA